MIKIIFIEDDAFLRENFIRIVEAKGDFSVLLQADSMEQLLEKLTPEMERPDIVILDIVLPGVSGIDGIYKIKELWPGVNIVMLSAMDDSSHVFRSLCAGAVGFLTKDIKPESLVSSLVDIYEGRGSMSPSIARKVAEYFHPQKSIGEKLSDREMEIVQGILKGLSYKMMAGEYKISIDTVRAHIKNIYTKLQVNSKTQLINLYYKI